MFTRLRSQMGWAFVATTIIFIVLFTVVVVTR